MILWLSIFFMALLAQRFFSGLRLECSNSYSTCNRIRKTQFQSTSSALCEQILRWRGQKNSAKVVSKFLKETAPTKIENSEKKWASSEVYIIALLLKIFQISEPETRFRRFPRKWNQFHYTYTQFASPVLQFTGVHHEWHTIIWPSFVLKC